MFTRLSLRLRIFLFFCLLAAGGAALALYGPVDKAPDHATLMARLAA